MTNRYVNSVAYAAVAQWAAGHVYAAGAIVRQLAATGIGGERCFRTAAGGTSAGAEPNWNLTPGGVTIADNTITDWTEVTGNETYQAPGAWSAPYASLLGPCSYYMNSTPGVGAAGAGYAVGDLLRVTGGTPVTNCGAIVKVKTVSAGAVTAYETMATTGTSGGAYVADPGSGALATAKITGAGNDAATVTFATRTQNHAAGDSIFPSSNHNAAYAAAATLLFAGTPASLNQITSVDESVSGHIPPGGADVKAGAIEATTGNNSFTPGGIGYAYIRGVTFNGGTGAVGAVINLGTSGDHNLTFENCALAKLGTGVGTWTLGIAASTSKQKVTLINTTIQQGNVGDSIRVRNQLAWRNTASAIQGATVPTTLFGDGGDLVLQGIDLSALGSGKTIIGAQTQPDRIYLNDCKFGASVTVAVTPTDPTPEIYVTRSDSSGTNYVEQVYRYTGTQIDETTIVRTGGATDGTTPKSRKITTTANSKWVLPFESNPIAIWNNTTGGNVTVTIHGTWNQNAVPNNDDIWIDVEYLGSNTSPLGSFATATKANNLASGTPLTADHTSVWGGGGSGAGWSPFVISVLLSAPQPAQVGTIYVYVKGAKATSTFYIDPLVTLS